MNCCVVSGVVVRVPELQERSTGTVCNFLIAVDGRGKQKTELWVCAWDSLITMAQGLSIGDHVAVTGHLSHATTKGITLTVKQLALVSGEASEPQPREAPQSEESDALTWGNYLDRGRETGLRTRSGTESNGSDADVWRAATAGTVPLAAK